MLAKRLFLLLVLLAGCASAGHEINDNPKITPTSQTGVTSDKGTNVYEKIPLPPTSTQ